MNLAILIPSKKRSEQLLKNISKSNINSSSINLEYHILVDNYEEYIEYKKILFQQNIKIYFKYFKYQSHRYAYLLKKTISDYYLIFSDDVFINFLDKKINYLKNDKLFCAENENKILVNHPIISDNIKDKVINILSNCKFSRICVDTILSYYFSSNSKETFPINIIHQQIFYPSKKNYKIFQKDILAFFKYIVLNKKTISGSKLFVKVYLIILLLLDLLSAKKNYYLANID